MNALEKAFHARILPTLRTRVPCHAPTLRVKLTPHVKKTFFFWIKRVFRAAYKNANINQRTLACCSIIRGKLFHFFFFLLLLAFKMFFKKINKQRKIIIFHFPNFSQLNAHGCFSSVFHFFLSFWIHKIDWQLDRSAQWKINIEMFARLLSSSLWVFHICVHGVCVCAAPYA